jgi:predicted Fe-S protein YdhL (DUF1289 family)
MTMPTEQVVKSPCIDICALDDKDVCVGCYRTGDEIAKWAYLDNQGKAAVVARALERRQQDGAFL